MKGRMGRKDGRTASALRLIPRPALTLILLLSVRVGVIYFAGFSHIIFQVLPRDARRKVFHDQTVSRPVNVDQNERMNEQNKTNERINRTKGTNKQNQTKQLKR